MSSTYKGMWMQEERSGRRGVGEGREAVKSMKRNYSKF
jgi:hypothetical protein